MDDKKTKAAASEQQRIKAESLFSKEQLLASNRFQGKKDILNAILYPDKKYTISTVEQMIEKYMKGKVK